MKKKYGVSNMYMTATYMRPHPGQEKILNHPARFKVVACGRRFGKTETGKIMLTDIALRGHRGWWLAPTYQMASQVWRDFKTTLMNVRGITISESERRIDFHGGGMIAIRSTHYPDMLRGEGLDYAILDEAAFMEPRVWPEIVRPMLADRRGGALFLSTPFGRNWFWGVFRIGMDPEEDDWIAFQFKSMDNPLIPPEEFETIQRTTSKRVWQAEYLAMFTEDAGQVFRGVRDVVTAPFSNQPEPGHRYIAGVDWGRDGDYTAIAIIDTDTRQMVALDRFNQIGWSLQRGRLQALCAVWKPDVVWAEANSIGSVNIEALQEEGLPVRPFITSARSKAPLIEGLALAIERGDIGLLPDQVLLDELNAYIVERMPGGGYRYTAPPGLHDDTVIATALAWHGVQYGGVRISFA